MVRWERAIPAGQPHFSATALQEAVYRDGSISGDPLGSFVSSFIDRVGRDAPLTGAAALVCNERQRGTIFVLQLA